ncbi:hypothetical protein TNCV_2705571 [Trichonephila clavipes]|nr:hypothetical protein TNCV_2705571 [Trichonephila clavipes]
MLFPEGTDGAIVKSVDLNETAAPSLHAEIVEVEIEVVSPSIVPSGNFVELKSYCHLYGANGRRTSCPCHDEFRGPRSDYVRQVASENNNNEYTIAWKLGQMK